MYNTNNSFLFRAKLLFSLCLKNTMRDTSYFSSLMIKENTRIPFRFISRGSKTGENTLSVIE